MDGFFEAKFKTLKFNIFISSGVLCARGAVAVKPNLALFQALLVLSRELNTLLLNLGKNGVGNKSMRRHPSMRL
ncbi:MAG: hypothetical protein AAFR49_05760 [Pseudomonadota bacterium]